MGTDWLTLVPVVAIIGMSVTAYNNVTALRQARHDLAVLLADGRNGSMLLMRRNVVASEWQRVRLIMTMILAGLASVPLTDYLPRDHPATWAMVLLSLGAVVQMVYNTRANLQRRVAFLAHLERETQPWDGVTERRRGRRP